MPSTNKTDKGLNQWVLTDHPVMSDFNADNNVISAKALWAADYDPSGAVKTAGGILSAVYPVGSIYMSVNAANPSALFGGTWVAWGAGRVPVGVNPSDSGFNASEKTGGSKTHTHPLSSAGGARIGANATVLKMQRNHQETWESATDLTVSTASNTASSVPTMAGLAGNTDSANGLPPYITCYLWKRTA